MIYQRETWRDSETQQQENTKKRDCVLGHGENKGRRTVINDLCSKVISCITEECSSRMNGETSEEEEHKSHRYFHW